jgi:hypothetical protein
MGSSTDNSLAAKLPDQGTAPLLPPCPVDRLPRRRRNQICIAIIAVGLLNFLVYTLSYAILGGDAHNGYRKLHELPDGTTEAVYVVRGHHVRKLEGLEMQVSQGVWIYSYLHSITVPLTSGALIISMLVLARPHIIATMRDGWFSGRTSVTAFGTIVILVSLSAAALFTAHFVAQLGGR